MGFCGTRSSGSADRNRAAIRAESYGSELMIRLAAIVFLCGIASARADPINARDLKVSDGDSIRIGSQRYRLVDFDTPETWSRWRTVSPRERQWGKHARKRLKELISSGDLDFAEVSCACTKQTTKDDQGRCRTHGRLCGVLKVNGESVGTTLISEGLAREFICSATECPERLPWVESEE